MKLQHKKPTTYWEKIFLS